MGRFESVARYTEKQRTNTSVKQVASDKIDSRIVFWLGKARGKIFVDCPEG
jgi:hypothetical protein